jgi:23S rRNA pseudouridine1911/1915/1917 synthase
MSRVSERQIELVYDGKEPQRLDKYLVKRLPEFSRSRLQGLIKDGFVTVNATTVSKSGLMLEKQDVVQMSIPAARPSTLQPEPIPLEVIYEDGDVMVVNKPAGMVVHPSAGHDSGTLVHAALAHAPEMGGISGEIRPGVVHRLDKNTSGLILLAKNDHTQRWLQDQFRARKVEKVYLALVDGHPPTPTGRIEAPIGRDPRQRKQMAVVAANKGREAVSTYITLETFLAHTLLELHPITGRTHQIRLHLSFIGCPVTGDTVYGRKRASMPIDRHFLHAASLTIRLPGENQPQMFQAPLPGELEQVLENLRAIAQPQ